jgi:hypothetical protein
LWNFSYNGCGYSSTQRQKINSSATGKKPWPYRIGTPQKFICLVSINLLCQEHKNNYIDFTLNVFMIYYRVKKIDYQGF